MIDPFENLENEGFTNSLEFVFLVVTFGGLFLLAVIGVFGKLIARALNRDVKKTSGNQEKLLESNNR